MGNFNINTVGEVLNVQVFIKTFSEEKVQNADIYENPNGANILVKCGSPLPVNCTFLRTITVEL